MCPLFYLKIGEKMKIAIASGKGGTGKTTIATNLAVSISSTGTKTQYLDCDAEEPNGHVFLKPIITQRADVTVGVPDVNESKCTACGKCAQLCQYSALTCIKDKILVFEQLCHSCGGCMAICPHKAISEKQRKIGTAEFGKSDQLLFGQATLDIGAIQTPEIIRYLKKNIIDQGVNVLDVPPGTSCPVIEAVKNADFVLLVTEPTPFGLNDLKLAVEMAKRLELKFAVAINRSDVGDDAVAKYCRRQNIPIFLEILNDQKIAKAYSRGEMVVDILPGYKKQFLNLFEKIEDSILHQG